MKIYKTVTIVEAEGLSMMPLIRPGDHLLISPPEKMQPIIGDLIAWKGGPVPVIHRMAGTDSRGNPVEAGDAGLRFTSRHRGAVMGRVAAVAPEKAMPWVPVGSGRLPGFIMHVARKRIVPIRIARFFIAKLGNYTRKKWMKEQKKMADGMGNSYPVTVQEVGDELMIYDPKTGDVHMLNRTAKMVWELAGKGMKEADIVARFRKDCPDAPENMAAYVRPVMNLLKNLHMVNG